jgi:hypothetical protein
MVDINKRYKLSGGRYYAQLRNANRMAVKEPPRWRRYGF